MSHFSMDQLVRIILLLPAIKSRSVFGFDTCTRGFSFTQTLIKLRLVLGFGGELDFYVIDVNLFARLLLP